MKNLLLFLTGFSLIIFTPNNVIAQVGIEGPGVKSTPPGAPAADGTRSMFVEIAALNETSYAKIHKALEDNDQMKVKQVCVPAGVLMLEIPASNSARLENNFTTFRDVVFNHTGIKDVKLLAEYSEDTFLARCKRYRGSE